MHWIINKNSSNRGELDATAEYFRDRVTLWLWRGPTAFIGLTIAIASILLTKGGAAPGEEPVPLFDITAPPFTNQWELAWVLILVVSTGLVAWYWLVLSNYARCPNHITVPHLGLVLTALGSTTILFMMLVYEVVDPGR